MVGYMIQIYRQYYRFKTYNMLYYKDSRNGLEQEDQRITSADMSKIKGPVRRGGDGGEKRVDSWQM